MDSVLIKNYRCGHFFLNIDKREKIKQGEKIMKENFGEFAGEEKLL